ncbi:hypothetical protein EW145_g2630 [Phellinidium pouzarii]|uniref:BTB domain-containing protein n=1 Tax=Phellinidium pouzarii TaxID=167371 RepID=A0A4S4LC32_9AGAM|nr:hypothetical protein EW145_g2630 [Phellinidium pouzarii]
MSSKNVDSNNLLFHPAYCDTPDAVLVLSASNGILFRVHSLVLKLASNVFKTMLDLPRVSTEREDDLILLSEGPETLQTLLDIIHPNQSLSGTLDGIKIPLTLVDSLWVAVVKYEIPGAMPAVRSLIQSPSLDCYPIEAYGLACHHGWREEATAISTRTLQYDLRSSESQRHLETILKSSPHASRASQLSQRCSHCGICHSA